MSEDEIIKYTNNIINATFIEATVKDKDGNIIEQGLVNKDVIQGLLDLYQKEKEKNRQNKMRIVQLEKEIDARIEDVNKHFISKDKTRKYIKENKRTYEMKTPNRNRIVYKDCVLLTKEVKEILKENNGKQM